MREPMPWEFQPPTGRCMSCRFITAIFKRYPLGIDAWPVEFVCRHKLWHAPNAHVCRRYEREPGSGYPEM